MSNQLSGEINALCGEVLRSAWKAGTHAVSDHYDQAGHACDGQWSMVEGED
jgi:hypothetical protein